MLNKDTLVTLIAEWYGDGYDLSWLIDLFIKALEQNAKGIVMATDDYVKREKLTLDTLKRLHAKLEKHEKRFEDRSYVMTTSDDAIVKATKNKLIRQQKSRKKRKDKSVAKELIALGKLPMKKYGKIIPNDDDLD